MTDAPSPLTRRTKVLALRAFMAGRRAALENQPVTTCPFQPDATATDATDTVVVNEATVERYLARMWIRGWTKQTKKLAT